MWGCGFGATTLAVRTRQSSLAQVAGLSAWYDPSDLTTLYQDTAMTVPVTAPGQSVAAMRDKSGNGRHMTQAVSAARPIYETDGAYHWLRFDGVDDLMTTPVKPIDGTSVFAGVAFALEPQNPPGNGGVLSDANYQGGGIQLGWFQNRQRINTNSMVEATASGSYDFSSDAQRRHVQAVFTGATPFAYFRDAGFVSFAPAYASSPTKPLTLGRGTQGGFLGFFPGKVYGAVYAGASRAEAEAMLGWVGGSCGLVL